MKGIILAGGRGSRLYPITRATCKQLLPIFDKPLIYYPLSVLMLAEIRDILLISTPEDRPRFEALFGDGSQYGISMQYAVQKEARGIADAFLIGKKFIGNSEVALILGDNIFYSPTLSHLLMKAKNIETGALVFGYEVGDPQRYGVIAFDEEGRVKEIIEKPLHPPSRYAVTGLYFYDNTVVKIAEELKPSKRGELEITDVNIAYLRKGALVCHLFERGCAWLDTGTPTAMQQAAQYVDIVQQRQGVKIGCIEEVAFEKGFIDEDQLQKLADALYPSDYGNYLHLLLRNRTALL